MWVNSFSICLFLSTRSKPVTGSTRQLWGFKLEQNCDIPGLYTLSIGAGSKCRKTNGCCFLRIRRSVPRRMNRRKNGIFHCGCSRGGDRQQGSMAVLERLKTKNEDRGRDSVVRKYRTTEIDAVGWETLFDRCRHHRAAFAYHSVHPIFQGRTVEDVICPDWPGVHRRNARPGIDRGAPCRSPTSGAIIPANGSTSA